MRDGLARNDAPRVVQVEPGTLYVGGASSGSVSVGRTLVNWPAVRQMQVDQLQGLLAGRALNELPADEIIAAMLLVKSITDLDGKPDEFGD